VDAGVPCGTPTECGTLWEQRAADRLEALRDAGPELSAFLTAVPKGGDLHNHLSGSVYAEDMLEWGSEDGNCINSSSFAAVSPGQCENSGVLPIPGEGTFYDQIVRAWSMLDFVPGVVSGHDHFFATFGKFGVIAGQHRDNSIANVLRRAADENQVYLETMFNLGTNVGGLSASLWPSALTAADLQTLYDQLLASPAFAGELAQDVSSVTRAASGYKVFLGCGGSNPPEACLIKLRFIAQVSRTGGNDQVFGQLVSAFEMAMVSPHIVGVNLSSPEDDTSSLRNYELHMQMLEFLHTRYTATGMSPLRVTLHAGELTPEYLPAGYENHITFHIRQAVEIAHAERIGHGLDILSETDPQGLLTLMRERNVLVETCLSSNDQILEVRGAAHPLDQYLAAGVPVALATDDQGVSRSSMAGEYLRAVRAQGLNYRQLKMMARTSLEHAFLPGASLWQTLATAEPVLECLPTDTMGVGDAPTPECQQFLDLSERAQTQWELERRFRAFESQQ